jgi:ribosome recycling factor
MNEKVRQDMAKQAKRKAEEAKVGIRNVRRDGNEGIRKQKADGEIPEDVMKKHEKRIQELTDKFCSLADKLAEDKEKEIMTI